MRDLDADILSFIRSLSLIPVLIDTYEKKQTEETGQKIVDLMAICDEKFLKVKKDLVIVVKEGAEKSIKEEDLEVSGIKTDSGYLIQ